MDPISLDIPVLMRIIVASLVGAILCLDRIVLQVMLSRPIVVASIIGLILGTPLTGLTAGALIEIFWIDKSPLGTFVPPNDSVVAIVTAITVITLGANQPLIRKELLVLAILFYLPLGSVSQKLEPLTARFNEMVSDKALQQAECENQNMKNISPVGPILIYFIYTLSLIALPLAIGLLFIPWIYDQLPPFAQMALFYTYYPLPLIGVAVVLTTTQHKKAPAYFSIIFLVSTLFMEIMGFI
jgi:mannose/fructose/N-acetylgalactosamine-specific phosphotransferase system component IIC